MSADQVIELSYENFDDEVYGQNKPVLVEFYSEGSYACRELSDIIDDVAREYGDKVIVGRLDIDTNWQAAEPFDVKTVPSVLLFQHDRLVERIDGAKTRAEYRQALNELVTQYWVI